MVIDFHTHIFPDKIAEKAIRTLEKNILEIQGAPTYAYLDGTLTDLKRSMRENEINRSVVLPIATKVTQSGTINNFAAEINGTDNIVSFGSIHPRQSDWEEELERISELGLIGIKLHPEYQGMEIDSAESVRVLKKAEKLGLLVTLHTGGDAGMPPPTHCSPYQLRKTLEKLDRGGENIIAAHMGGWQCWEESAEFLAGTPVMFDTSYSVRFMKRETLDKIFSKHSPDKILFGSDSPWDDQGSAVRGLKNIGLGKDECDKILYKNAERIFNAAPKAPPLRRQR